MDGQRPREELSDAIKRSHVLKYLPPEAKEREFAVEEIVDADGACLTTVVRPRSDDDVKATF